MRRKRWIRIGIIVFIMFAITYAFPFRYVGGMIEADEAQAAALQNQLDHGKFVIQVSKQIAPLEIQATKELARYNGTRDVESASLSSLAGFVHCELGHREYGTQVSIAARCSLDGSLRLLDGFGSLPRPIVIDHAIFAADLTGRGLVLTVQGHEP